MSEHKFYSVDALRPIVKTWRMRQIERAHAGADVRLVVMRLYEALGSQRAVARALGLSQSTVSDWLAQLGIHTAASGKAWLDKDPP